MNVFQILLLNPVVLKLFYVMDPTKLNVFEEYIFKYLHICPNCSKLVTSYAIQGPSTTPYSPGQHELSKTVVCTTLRLCCLCIRLAMLSQTYFTCVSPSYLSWQVIIRDNIKDNDHHQRIGASIPVSGAPVHFGKVSKNILLGCGDTYGENPISQYFFNDISIMSP